MTELRNQSGFVTFDQIAGLLGLAFIGGIIAAWVTHIIATIQAGAYILLAIGAFLAPVGVIHGVMIWLGMPWAS